MARSSSSVSWCSATTAPGLVRFIPTHQGHGLPAEEIAALPIRAGSTKNPSYLEPLGAQCFTDFDWFAVLDTMAYNQREPSLEGWSRTETSYSK